MELLLNHAGNLLAQTKAEINQNKAAHAYEQLYLFAIDVLDCDSHSIFECICKCVSSVLEIRKCCLYLLDETSEQLWTVNGEQHTIVNVLSNISTSVAGQAATSRETVVQIFSLDTSECSELAADSAFKPHLIGSPIVCPISHTVLGVIEAITVRYILIIRLVVDKLISNLKTGDHCAIKKKIL